MLDRLDRAVATALLPATESEGVSREGWRVLLMLARGSGRSMGEIAAHTALPAPTATRVVDRLVESRLAYRHTDAVDRRRVLVHLGADGRELVERVCDAGRALRRGAARRHPHPPNGNAWPSSSRRWTAEARPPVIAATVPHGPLERLSCTRGDRH